MYKIITEKFMVTGVVTAARAGNHYQSRITAPTNFQVPLRVNFEGNGAHNLRSMYTVWLWAPFCCLVTIALVSRLI